MQFGISTFGEVERDKGAGNAINAHKRIQQLILEGQKADEWGLDVFALGEHHRPDFVISSPEMVLAAVASKTKNIRLSSAVTVLSSSDPVKVFQNFATLDLISSGRAEIMAGRGSFIESFPLFGYNLENYEELFIEKLDLLIHIIQNEVTTWKGKLRASIEGIGIYPRPLQPQIPLWIAVGGTPASVIRAAKLGLPLTIAILGSSPARFTTLTNLYKETWIAAGHDIKDLQLCINEHLYIAETREKAINEYWPVYGRMMNRIGRERGWSPMDKQYFERLCEPDGSLMVGTAGDVADKLLYQHGLFNNTRFLAQIISGDIEHEKILRSIELFSKESVPEIKEGIRKIKTIS